MCSGACDYQFSLSTTPLEFEQAHQAFMGSNTTAIKVSSRTGVIPYSTGGITRPKALYARGVDPEVFARAVSPYEPVWLCHLTQLSLLCGAGVPQTQVLLWVYGEQLRAVVDNVV